MPAPMQTMDEILSEVASLLEEKKLRVATAESCTGGLLGHMLTNVPGSSTYYEGGVVAYSNSLKTKLLGVSRATLERYGAVSAPTARQMAEGIRQMADVDIGLATTGIAGPGGSTPEKPVGLVYVALAAHTTEVREFRFPGDRGDNKLSTVREALQILREHVQQHD